jgi:hypothetical protein
MSKNKFLLILAGSIAGGIIYSLFASFLDYFTPITGMLAGFAGCICLIASIDGKKDHPYKYIPVFIELSILSLFFGYVNLYYIKAEFVHGTSFHPVDIMTFKEFMTINFGFPDILSAIIGGLAAYGLFDKISASIRGIFSSCSRYG